MDYMCNLEKEIIDKLQFINIFSEDEKNTFFTHAYQVNYSSGKTLIESSKTCQSVYFVISGLIRVFKLTPEGKELTLYRISSGDTCLFTMGCIMGNTNFEALAETEQDSVLVALPGDIFKSLMFSNKEFSEMILSKILTTLTELMILTEEVTFHSINKRVASYLVSKNTEIIKNTHEEIANELGSAREVVSRMLKEFEKSSIVTLKRGSVTIKDRKKLEILAEM
jgi:CRP/FNR family transcriptional regulator